MYSEQIEKLIELALADGELTEKEKNVLLKKAEAEGIDKDEFEMVLNAKLYEKNNKNADHSYSPPKNKHGEVRACSSCGAPVIAFSAVCADCGFEFTNISTNKSVANLSRQLQEIVIACERKSYAQQSDREFLEGSARQEDIISKQKGLIKNFPIPQTREDLLELLHFIHPKTKVGLSSDRNVEAWRNKFLEILNRAKSAYSTDERMLAEIERYEKEQQISKYSKVLLMFHSLNPIGKLIAGFIGICLIGVLILGIDELGSFSDIKKEENRLKKLESEIMQDIKNNKVEDAKLLLNQLEWSITEDKPKTFMDDLIKVRDKYQDKRDYWNNKRSKLITLIKENKNPK